MSEKDQCVLKERGEKYGPIEPMWTTIGVKQWANFSFLWQKCCDQGREPTSQELGHLAAMNMQDVKVVRSIQDPTYDDNYVDGRNYWTIGERVGSGD